MPNLKHFDPNSHRQIKLSGKIVLITGGSAGIGKVNVRQFAELGAKVYVIARNKEKTLAVLDDIKAKTGNSDLFFIQADLDSLASIKNAANEFLNKETRLHIFICNAGASTFNKPWPLDGFETLFGQNYLSHFLLTHLLMDCLKQTANALGNVQGSVRIINVSSEASDMFGAPTSLDFASMTNNASPTADAATNFVHPGILAEFSLYGRSKLCQVLSTVKLAQILKDTGISVYSLHPGVVASNIYDPYMNRGGVFAVVLGALNKVRAISEEQGSLTTLYCALSNDVAGESGLFYDNCAVRKNKNKCVGDQDLVNELWTR
ncbi:Retinol dehydrogenase 12, partial [Physocladia obscura]